MKKIAILVFVGLLSICGINAQEAVGNKAVQDPHIQDDLEKTEVYTYQPGDTIVISKHTKHYLTGETISKWVYYVKHTIRQVGGKRFPNGILVGGIMSWVEPDDLFLMGPVNPTEQAKAKQQTDQQEVKIEHPGEIKEVGATVGEAERAAKEEEGLAPDTTLTSRPKPVIVQSTQTETFVMEKEEKPKPEPFDRVSIGLRGGAASLMHDAPVMGKWGTGFNAMLDIQYAHYWQATYKKNYYGILTGVGIGYAESPIGKGVDTTYTVTTSDGPVNYDISAKDVREHDGQIQLEVPILFTMIHSSGFFLNAGPKIVVPVYGLYRQNITSPDIKATFPEMGGVEVDNKAITGYVQDDQMKTKGKWSTAKLSVYFTAELGYEWKLKNGNALGLGVYGNYGISPIYNNTTADKSLINVTPPSGSNAAQVDVVSATDTYNKGIGYFDAGVKIAYHFNLRKKSKSENDQ